LAYEPAGENGGYETVKSALNQLLKIIDIPDDYTILIENKRCKLPTASVYPNQKLIRIEANKPSLIRYALAELILHEVAEDEFYSISPNSLDSHSSSEFHALERRWRRRLERAIYDEHYDAEDEEIDQIEQLGGLTD
jgi:hypothetical protein